MSQSPVYGYANHLGAYQTPKSERRGCGLDNDARPGNCYSANQKYNYVPFDGGCEPVKRKEFDGSGAADETLRCQCVDCGAPADGPTQACCFRCGSTNEPRCQ